MSTASLILASSSPRRIDLLRDLGITPAEILAADIDEAPLSHELPRALASRLAKAKAEKIKTQRPGGFILAADTVVACGRRILPKAETPDEVADCLKLLSGRRHHVYTGVTLIKPDGTSRNRVCDSTVIFHRLAPSDIATYAASSEGIGKAGGYAIQGKAAAYIRFISGSYSNIVGLPLFETAQLLRGAGYVW